MGTALDFWPIKSTFSRSSEAGDKQMKLQPTTHLGYVSEFVSATAIYCIDLRPVTIYPPFSLPPFTSWGTFPITTQHPKHKNRPLCPIYR